MMHWLMSLLVAYLLWLSLGLALQRRILFPRHLAGSPNTGDFGQQVHFLEVPGARVEWWFLPGLSVDARHPAPLVLFAHGNAEFIDDCAPIAQFYNQAGISVALVEYRGYGRSTGSPSQAAITQDYIAVYDQLAGRPDVDRRRIFFHGRSLGGGVVCALAAHRKPAALVLQSTFTSVSALAGRYLIPPFLVRDRFDNQAVLAGYDGPVLICHGRHDTIVPFSHAQRLQRIAPHATLHAFDCGHNDFPLPTDEPYHRILTDFLAVHRLQPTH